ncbi:MAG: Na+/H+ antiporter subunit E [Actinomycetota bacterium]|nr:Na+/H+ antiporter subunit E [Actinomycetota bacterium]
MSQRLLSLTWMTLVWMALWGDISVANALGGIVVGSAILLIVPPRGLSSGLTLRPFSALRLGAYFSWQLVEASAIVAWEVITPVSRLNQAIVAVPLRTRSRVLAALVGNMVSLTPGTLTLDVLGDPPVLYVHVLHLRDGKQILASIHTLEALALRAFSTEEHQ